MASLDQNFQNTRNLSDESRSEIAAAFWGQPPRRLHNKDLGSGLELSHYFNCYELQCTEASHDGGKCISIACHRDILKIVGSIKSGLTRDEIRLELATSNQRNTTENDDRSIDLAAGLVTMIRFGTCRHVASPHTELNWSDGTMQEFLDAYFNDPPKLGAVRLSKDFNARNLSLIAGIDAIPTNNLTDHLSLGDNERTVKIFDHVSFLEYQKDGAIFPEGFIEETLRTIALLFPSEPETRKWAAKRFRTTDPRLVRCGHLRGSDRQIEQFKFWHDRIVMLKQAYDDSTPTTFLQWCYDQRNGERWYTFWVAVVILGFTIFFGVVQTIEGAIQVHKAYHPSTNELRHG